MRAFGALCGLLLAASAVHATSTFDQIKRLASRSPEQAWALLPQVERAADRAILERLILIRAASLAPEIAARQLPAFLSAPWLGDILFADAVRVAKAADPEFGRRLVLASTAHHPDAALQSWALIEREPYAHEVLGLAAARAPDAAVELLAGSSPYSDELRAVVAKVDDAPLQRLAQLAAAKMPDAIRARLAFLDTDSATAADPGAFFHALAEQRFSQNDPGRIATLDRALERVATSICQTFQQTHALPSASLSGRDQYLLLAYARAGDEDTYFAQIFDRWLRSGNIAAAIQQARHLRLADFIDYTLWFRRYPQLLARLKPAEASALLAELVRGLNLNQGLTAADAFESTPASVLALLKPVIANQSPADAEQLAIKQALERALVPRAPVAQSISTLATGTVPLLGRYFFYDDADGVESFASFQAQYARDKSWHWEDRGSWVRLTGGAANRRIEIIANRPSMKPSPDALLREQAIAHYLSEREPVLVVHRGHAYHAPKTIDQLTRSARLVFLGSCRGLKEIRDVIDAAPQADIISTRAVGTKRVNDPLLKMLNRAMLEDRPLAWPAFWRAAQSRFARDADFSGYVGPHRNGAARFMRLVDSLR